MALWQVTHSNSSLKQELAFVILAYSFIGTWILALAIDKIIGLRVKEEEEYVGLDISQHGESSRA